MSELVERIKEQPTWLLALVAAIVGIVVIIPVTVILAAVIGTFVLGIGGSGGEMTQSPTTAFDYTHNSDTNELTITHAGGDEINANNIYFIVDESSHDWSGSGTISIGSETTIPNVSSGDELRIIWESPDGNTVTLTHHIVE